MKKIIFSITVLLMAICLIGCADSNSTENETETPETPSGVVIKASDTPSGYASLSWSTTAGSSTSKIKTVSTKADLVSYATTGGYIIYINGMIDMSEGMLPSEGGGSTTALDTFVSSKSLYSDYASFKTAYAASCTTTTEDGTSSAPQSSVGPTLWTLNAAYGNKIKLNIASNTTIIGLTSSSGIKGGTIQINSKNNIVLRNLILQDAYDPFPHHEKDDGYNAQWDGICMQGTASNIWIDHCTIQDTLHCTTVINGDSAIEKWQTYDGLCDMKGSVKNITVSYCKFMDHDKTMLIGSSDSDGSNTTRMITLHHNYFYNCGQRLPMVRNTTLHLYNNFYTTSSPYYTQQYAVGVRANAIIYAENNYFDSGINYSFKDSYGSLYSSGNTDNSSNGCSSTITGKTLFSSAIGAYSYTASSASDAKTNVTANAGAGKWTVQQ